MGARRLVFQTKEETSNKAPRVNELLMVSTPAKSWTVLTQSPEEILCSDVRLKMRLQVYVSLRWRLQERIQDFGQESRPKWCGRLPRGQGFLSSLVPCKNENTVSPFAVHDMGPNFENVWLGVIDRKPPPPGSETKSPFLCLLRSIVSGFSLSNLLG